MLDMKYWEWQYDIFDRIGRSTQQWMGLHCNEGTASIFTDIKSNSQKCVHQVHICTSKSQHTFASSKIDSLLPLLPPRPPPPLPPLCCLGAPLPLMIFSVWYTIHPYFVGCSCVVRWCSLADFFVSLNRLYFVRRKPRAAHFLHIIYHSAVPPPRYA